MADPWNWHGVDDDDAYYEEMDEKRERRIRREVVAAKESRSELAPMPLKVQKQVTKELDKMWWASDIPF